MRLAIAVAVSIVVVVPVFVVAVLMGGLISGSAVIRARMLARHRRSTSKLSMRAMTLTSVIVCTSGCLSPRRIGAVPAFVDSVSLWLSLLKSGCRLLVARSLSLFIISLTIHCRVVATFACCPAYAPTPPPPSLTHKQAHGAHPVFPAPPVSFQQAPVLCRCSLGDSECKGLLKRRLPLYNAIIGQLLSPWT